MKSRIVIWVQNGCKCIGCSSSWSLGCLGAAAHCPASWDSMGITSPENIKTQSTVYPEYISLSHHHKVKKIVSPRRVWVAQSVKLLALAGVMISGSWDGVTVPCSLGCLLFSPSAPPSTCASPFSQINKIFKKYCESQIALICVISSVLSCISFFFLSCISIEERGLPKTDRSAFKDQRNTVQTYWKFCIISPFIVLGVKTDGFKKNFIYLFMRDTERERERERDRPREKQAPCKEPHVGLLMESKLF